jgi:hypothetical protein
VLERLQRLERLRTTEVCLIAPALQPGWQTAFLIRRGVVCARRPLPPGPGALTEIQAGLAITRAAPNQTRTLSPEQVEDMLLIDSFVRRPPPELAVLPIDAHTIRAHLERRPRMSAA